MAALTSQVVTHDAKIDGHDDDIKALREVHREAVQEFRGLLRDFDVSCERKVSELKVSIDAQGRKIDEQGKKVDEVSTRRWTPADKVALWAPLVGSIGVVLAVVVGR